MMLTGIELFQHRFSGNPENQCVFFELAKIEPVPGSPFSDHFWRLFFEKFCIALFLGKILVANYRIVCEVNFAPKAQKFSTDIRKSAVLDAVLEDKPAQPLPCGSYLVNPYCGTPRDPLGRLNLSWAVAQRSFS